MQTKKYPLAYKEIAARYFTLAAAAEIATTIGADADNVDELIAYLRISIAKRNKGEKPTAREHMAHEKVLGMVTGMMYGIALERTDPMLAEAVADYAIGTTPDLFPNEEDQHPLEAMTKMLREALDEIHGGTPT